MPFIICLVIGFGIMVILGYLFTDAHIKYKEDRETLQKISQDIEKLKNKNSPDE